MISLIVTTRSRVNELHRLLASLEAQTHKDFEVIIVDQNDDDRLAPVLKRHRSLTIRRLRSGPGASRGRNAGLRACAGDLVSFPDDDCWYPNDLLANVVHWLETHPEYDGLLTGFCNPDGRLMAPIFAPQQGPCSRANILRCVIAWNMFLRSQTARSAGFFREEMGPGAASPYQSGEDLEYPLRVLDRGFRLWYAPQFKIYHPDLRFRKKRARLKYQYAQGVGRAWRIHGFSWTFCLTEVGFRALGRAVLDFCSLQPSQSLDALIRAAGELRGYLSYPGDDTYPAQAPADDHA
jgi:glycosyltransferase involved in cell wall biosynthesis